MVNAYISRLIRQMRQKKEEKEKEEKKKEEKTKEEEKKEEKKKEGRSLLGGTDKAKYWRLWQVR